MSGVKMLRAEREDSEYGGGGCGAGRWRAAALGRGEHRYPGNKVRRSSVCSVQCSRAKLSIFVQFASKVRAKSAKKGCHTVVIHVASFGSLMLSGVFPA